VARLALFIPELSAGGAQQALLTLSPRFVAATGPIDLVLARADGELMARIPDGVRVVDLSAGHPPRTRLGLGVLSMLRLARYLRRERPRTLLSTLTGANLVAAAARALARTPIRLVLREANTPENLRGRQSLRAVRLLYPRADAVIAVSSATRAGLVEVAGVRESRIHTIFNPIDVDRIVQLAGDPPGHDSSGEGEQQVPLVLTLGRLVPQKDPLTLLEAFARVRAERRARLVIAGEGPLRPTLETRINQLGLEADVDLPGFVANPYPLIARAAVFALPSRWEGMPNVLLEALALGTPIVATDCGSGAREILDQGNLGRLIGVGDTDALAKALLAELDDPMPANQLRQRASMFAADRIATAYLDVLEVGTD
jgi:glycosyltransferase involved in cell wall biosynthesis